MRYLICNGFLVAKGPMRLANIIGIPSTLDPFQNFDEPRMRLISGSPVVVLLASPSCTLYSSFPPSYWFGCCIGRLKRLDHANLLLVHNNRHIQRKRLALDALLFILGKHILPKAPARQPGQRWFGHLEAARPHLVRACLRPRWPHARRRWLPLGYSGSK